MLSLLYLMLDFTLPEEITNYVICVSFDEREQVNKPTPIDPAKVVRRFNFSHPLFTPAGLANRTELLEKVNGRRHTWFCGAWCRNGFHEDGVVSALAVAAGFGESL